MCFLTFLLAVSLLIKLLSFPLVYIYIINKLPALSRDCNPGTDFQSRDSGLTDRDPVEVHLQYFTAKQIQINYHTNAQVNTDVTIARGRLFGMSVYNM
jgi:hypothetical protein